MALHSLQALHELSHKFICGDPTSIFSLLEHFDCNGNFICKRTIIATLLGEGGRGGSAGCFLLTGSLLMAPLYSIYENLGSKGALYFYINRNI